MNIRIRPILANMQLKNVRQRPAFSLRHAGAAKWPVSGCEMACFRLRNGLFWTPKWHFCNVLNIKALDKADIAAPH